MNFAANLARLVISLEPAALTGELRRALKLIVLDGFACALAGHREPLSSQTLQHVQSQYGSGVCAVLGADVRTSAAGAAFANATLMHACDFDDSSWTMFGHPTAPLLPAVLAGAKIAGIGGCEMLSALAAGIEVEKCFGLATQPGHYIAGWHPTATLGIFGAAAGAGKTIGLGETQLRHAFGIAASLSAGVRANAGTPTKPLHVGAAARSGMEAALLAQAGVEASAEALDGQFGFFALYARHGAQGEATLTRFGAPFEALDPGISPKIYPCCSDLHCAIDATLDLARRCGFHPDDVAQLTAWVLPNAQPNVDRRNPRTPTEAKFSMSYCLAAALLDGGVRLRHFEGDALHRRDISALSARISVAIDPDLSGDAPAAFSSPARVQVTLASGKTHVETVREMRGHPQRPLSEEQLVEKFRDCADPRLVEPDALLEAIRRLDELDHIDALLGPASPGGRTFTPT